MRSRIAASTVALLAFTTGPNRVVNPSDNCVAESIAQGNRILPESASPVPAIPVTPTRHSRGSGNPNPRLPLQAITAEEAPACRKETTLRLHDGQQAQGALYS